MAIDDIGGDPVELATCVVDQIPNLTPPIPILEIATAVDITEIREEPFHSLEGALITPDHKGTGVILLNSNRSHYRKRYTIAHELGHYFNPWHQPQGGGFNCDAKALLQNQSTRNNPSQIMEVQANQFAAELLMPKKLFQRHLVNMSGLDLEHIIKLSDDFDISREAIARRYIALSDEPAALVFSKYNKIRYIKKHDNFPRLNVWNDHQLPSMSYSASASDRIGIPSDWRPVDEDNWLEHPTRAEMYEQTMAQQNGFRITLLTIDRESDENDEWDAPTFKR